MRLTWKLAAAALAATAVLALASACGDDNSSNKTSTPAANSTTAASTTHAGASATKGSSNATPQASSSAISNAIDELDKSSDNFIKADYDVTYKFTTTSDGKAVDSSMVIKHKGTKNSITLEGDLAGGGTNSKATIIDDGTNSYICSDEQKSCLKTSSSTAEGNFGQLFTAIKPDKLLGAIKSEQGAQVSDAPGQTIAGRGATCYKITSSEGNGTVCFDKKTDVMLLLDMTSETDGPTKMVATNVAGSPSDDDFKPPYKVQDLSSGSGG